MEPDPTDDGTLAFDEAFWGAVAAAALLRSHPQFDETVLDAWCRDGSVAVPTAELVGPGGHVDAIDPDASLAASARERGADLPQLTVHIADPAEWTTGDYDLVQCVLGLASCGAPDDTARHLVSLAKPGGRVVISLWADGALAPLRDCVLAALSAEETEPDEASEPADTAQSDQASEPDAAAESDEASEPDATAEPDETPEPEGTTESDPTSETSSLPGTPGTLAAMLHELGLAEVRAERVDRHLDLAGDLAWRLAVATGLLPAERLEALDEAGIARVRARLLDEVAERALTRVDASTLVAVGRRPA